MSLIKQAHQQLTENQILATQLQLFVEEIDTTIPQLSEAVTHVLAGIGQNAQSMSPNSIAAFLAGIEKIATVYQLVKQQTPDKKQNTIRLLMAAAMKFDDLTKQSLPNQSVVKIAQYGAADQNLNSKYLDVVKQGPQAITDAANKLKIEIDRAMRAASTTQQGQQPQQKQVQQPQQKQVQQTQQAPVR